MRLVPDFPCKTLFSGVVLIRRAFSVSEALDSYALQIQLLPTGKRFLEDGVNSLTSETIDQSIRHQLPSKLPNFLHDSSQ